jgi:2,3-bisphosphoglycerate-independent phosphoglycerate mutase
VLLLPDHATPTSIKTHSGDPVPFTIAGTAIVPGGVESFDEDAAKRGGYGRVEAKALVGMMNAI